MKINKLWLLTLIISIFTLFLWALDENFTFSKGTLAAYLAPIAGTLSILYMALDYITATRLKFLENLAGGLDVLYEAHSKLGKYAGVIVLGHPIFLIISRFTGIETILRMLFPGNSLFLNVGIFSIWILILLIILTVFVNMEYRAWKIVHRLMVVPFLLGAWHILITYISHSPGITLKEAWIILFIILGVLSFIYRDFIYPFLGYNYRVVRVNNIGLVTELYMEPISKALESQAGQYVFMSVQDNPQISRESHPFGISSTPNERIIRVSIKHLGDYTKTMPRVKVGDTVKVWGPYGHFTWENFVTYKKQVWIAGGIGVAPFLSKAKLAVQTQSDIDVTMFYVEKNSSECEYNEELTNLFKDQSTIKFYNHYDDTDGYLNAKAVAEKAGALDNALILLCGPEAMIFNLEKQFRAMGVPPEMIKHEDFTMKR